MSEEKLIDQVDRIVQENQHLRIKSNSDDTTIHLMKQQYDSLAASVASVRQKAAAEVRDTKEEAEREITDMTIERDQAVRAFKEIDSVLLQAADLIMQALRARAGDDAPEKMPEARMPVIQDDRLPIARFQ